MKITATFDSLEEFQAFVRGEKPLTTEELNANVQKTADIIDAAEEKMEAEKKAEKKRKVKEPEVVGATPEEMEELEAEKEKDEEIDYIALRVKTQKTLAELNKASGKNQATKLIKKVCGVDRYTEVKNAQLPALLKEAEEALNAE